MKKLTLLALVLVFSGCTDSGQLGPGAGTRMVAERSDANAGQRLSSNADSQAARRYLALKHKVRLLVPAASMTQHFAAIQAQCLKLGCDIVSASQEAESPHQHANAALIARVPPAAFPGFFADMQAHGKLLSHHSESEDKTAEVIDVDARIKNLEALKVRVLELLAKNAGSLKDMLDAEKQLAETQAALDSIHGQRRALAAQTDMIRVEVELKAEVPGSDGSWSAPVVEAADEAGQVLMQSIAALLTATVALLPWLVVMGLIGVPLRRLWRRRAAAKRVVEVVEK